jgi:hypothetical protein
MIGLGLLAGLGGIASNWMGAQAMNKPLQTQAISPEEIRDYMKNSQSMVGQMQGIGTGLMDPSSALNQRQQGMMRDASANQLAMQAVLNRRRNAQMGADSGIGAAQDRAQQRLASVALQNQMQNQLNQNYMQGIGVLGSQQQAQMGIDENIAQSAIAQRQSQMDAEQQQRMMQASQWSGLGQGLLGIIPGLFGGG